MGGAENDAADRDSPDRKVDRPGIGIRSRAEGRRFLWRDIVKLRQEQRRAAAKAEQPPLFELREDCRPATERTAAGRYREPSLFSLLDH